MKYMMIAGAVGLSLMGTSCATKKYVAKQVTPVEAHVSNVEAKNDTKNADQDKTISDQGKQVGEIQTDLSRTKERLTDTDARANAAGQAAAAANQAAAQANTAAGAAQRSADGARSTADQANQGVTRLERTVDGLNKFEMTKSVTVLFPVNQAKLSADDKKDLDDFAKQVDGMQRYMIEIQGFTDKTGSANTNVTLSGERADSVARYLVNEHKVPLHAISMLGSGYALPVADDKTREGRKQNRRVEVRLFVPETGSGASTVARAGE